MKECKEAIKHKGNSLYYKGKEIANIKELLVGKVGEYIWRFCRHLCQIKKIDNLDVTVGIEQGLGASGTRYYIIRISEMPQKIKTYWCQYIRLSAITREEFEDLQNRIFEIVSRI